jgi:transcriptional regulator with XRE-family HTH domain
MRNEDYDRNWKGRAKSSFWTLLRHDDYLRTVVKLFITLTGKSQRQICRELGISPDLLTNYLRGNDKMMNDLKLLSLCDYLGIKVELKITIDEEKTRGSE